MNTNQVGQSPNINFEEVRVEEILNLRHRILRTGLPFETARFEGDNLDTTLYFAIFLINEKGKRIGGAIGCVTVVLNQYDGEVAYQLRGMVTDPKYQGCGLGQKLLNFLLSHKDVKSVGLLWCNARESAIGFYEKQGWKVVSDLFEIEGVGPHKVMVKRI